MKTLRRIIVFPALLVAAILLIAACLLYLLFHWLWSDSTDDIEWEDH